MYDKTGLGRWTRFAELDVLLLEIRGLFAVFRFMDYFEAVIAFPLGPLCLHSNTREQSKSSRPMPAFLYWSKILPRKLCFTRKMKVTGPNSGYQKQGFG